jgi:phosphate transport system substrate-binding protein
MEEADSMQRLQGRARLATLIGAVGITGSLIAGAAAPAALARPAGSTQYLTGAGSTFINPLMTRWRFVYSTSIEKGVRINYQSVGSGAGISALTNGAVDFAGSDAFLNDTQESALKDNAVHVALTLGPVAMLYNLPGISNLKLDGPTLAQIYLGKITKWNDRAIASLNPGTNLPSTSITVAHRSDGSGTSFIFTNYLAAVSPAWKSAAGAGLAVDWPTGQGGKGTPGVVAIVKSTPGAIGYGELSYAVSSGLPSVSIKNQAGQFIAPSPQGASADAANAGKIPADLKALVVGAPGKGSYPISGFSWGILYQKVPNGGEYARYQPLLKFMWWAIHQGQSYATSGELRYAPLPSNVVKADEANIKSITYNGKPVFQG